MSLLHELNNSYLELHRAKENAFWVAKMGLKGNVAGDFEQKEIRLKEYISDASKLPLIRAELERPDLTSEERTGLDGWLHFFSVNSIESPEALALQNRIIEMEGLLDRARRDMPLGYVDPASGRFVPTGSVGLALMIVASPDEALRKAAWEGLRSIEGYVLDHGFLEIVKERNRLGRMLGYADYYDYKVSINEGFSKEKLFELLDDLEQNTREACRQSIERLISERGEAAIAPWNFDYYTQGDLTTQTDPYFRFDAAVELWGESFAAMNIHYGSAKLTLDLVDRKGKYENGFMHGPVPGFIQEGSFLPAEINFTANAVPGQVGSGQRALKTLFHEGGHAAHFSNIRMPAPCFSQEFAPTSVAFAETQSMFLDSLLGDADWLDRYATNEAGESMPLPLIRQLLCQQHEYRAHQLRKMLAVPYAEKGIYELSESELTPERVLEIIRSVETRMLYQEGSGRPILSIPHLLAGESSAYYHGYVLAQMAVFQTRDFFLKRDGHIVDNPNVGRDLTEGYWRPGNSLSFLELVERLTGEPFSARATVDLVSRSVEDVYRQADESIAREKEMPRRRAPVELDAEITVINGDDHIATTAEGGFEEMSRRFADWIRREEENAREAADRSMAG